MFSITGKIIFYDDFVKMINLHPINLLLFMFINIMLKVTHSQIAAHEINSLSFQIEKCNFISTNIKMHLGPFIWEK